MPRWTFRWWILKLILLIGAVLYIPCLSVMMVCDILLLPAVICLALVCHIFDAYIDTLSCGNCGDTRSQTDYCCEYFMHLTKKTATNFFPSLEKRYKKHIITYQLDPRLGEHARRIERISLQYEQNQSEERNRLYATCVPVRSSTAIANDHVASALMYEPCMSHV